MGLHNGGPVSYQALAFCPQVESYLRQAAAVAEGTLHTLPTVLGNFSMTWEGWKDFVNTLINFFL